MTLYDSDTECAFTSCTESAYMDVKLLDQARITTPTPSAEQLEYGIGLGV